MSPFIFTVTARMSVQRRWQNFPGSFPVGVWPKGSKHILGDGTGRLIAPTEQDQIRLQVVDHNRRRILRPPTDHGIGRPVNSRFRRELRNHLCSDRQLVRLRRCSELPHVGHDLCGRNSVPDGFELYLRRRQGAALCRTERRICVRGLGSATQSVHLRHVRHGDFERACGRSSDVSGGPIHQAYDCTCRIELFWRTVDRSRLPMPWTGGGAAPTPWEPSLRSRTNLARGGRSRPGPMAEPLPILIRLRSTSGVETVTATFVPIAVTQVASVPPGLALKVDNRDNWPSYNFPWGIGETHRLEAPAQLTDSPGPAVVVCRMVQWRQPGAGLYGARHRGRYRSTPGRHL